MSQLELTDNDAAANREKASTAYVPTLQRTAGQPPPIAANGGLSYMSFDRDGDAGTTRALEDALAEIAEHPCLAPSSPIERVSDFCVSWKGS